jgi:hypothetical protein
MKKIFKNVGGNQFKLLTESIEKDAVNESTSLIRSGLKKVFSSGNKELSYKRVQSVGLGYIKSPSEAAKTALQEAREIAAECGYVDNPNQAKFVREVDWYDEESYKHSHGDTQHDEEDMSNPEEAREVQIGKEIIKVIESPGMDQAMETEKGRLRKLATELIDMHTKKPDKKPYSGSPIFTGGGHGGL